MCNTVLSAHYAVTALRIANPYSSSSNVSILHCPRRAMNIDSCDRGGVFVCSSHEWVRQKQENHKIGKQQQFDEGKPYENLQL